MDIKLRPSRNHIGLCYFIKKTKPTCTNLKSITHYLTVRIVSNYNNEMLPICVKNILSTL